MKIIILCYTDYKIHVFPYDENIYESFEDFFDSKIVIKNKLFLSNCYAMMVKDLEIKIH